MRPSHLGVVAATGLMNTGDGNPASSPCGCGCQGTSHDAVHPK